MTNNGGSKVPVSMGKYGGYIAFEGVDTIGKSTQAELLAKELDAVLTFEPGGTELGQQIRSLLLSKDEQAMPATAAETLLFAADRAQQLAEVVLPALCAGKHVITDRSYGSTLAYQGYGRQVAIERIWELVLWTSRLTSSLTDNGVDNGLAHSGLAHSALAGGGLVEAGRAHGRFVLPAGLTDASNTVVPNTVVPNTVVPNTSAGELFLLPDVVVLLDMPLAELAEQSQRSAIDPDRFEKESHDFMQRVADGYRTLAAQDDSRWVLVDASGTPAEVTQRVMEALEANPMFQLITSQAE